MTMGRSLLFIQHVVVGIALAIVFGLVFGWAVMVAWNAVVPAVFSLPLLGYWQAVALLVLCRILVGGFTHGAHGHGRLHRRAMARGTGATTDDSQYEDWWEEEGRVSFEAYVARRLAARKGESEVD